MINKPLIFLFLSFLFVSSSFAADPVEILQKSDEIRFPRDSFEVKVRVTTTGEDNEERLFHVISKGNVNSIIYTEEPAIDRGQSILMRGRELWIFMPEVSQAIRLSLSQRLTGQVANGDLARANFSGDYTPTIAGEEEIEGQKHWVLDLQGVDKSVTYAKVKLWVNQENHRPRKAEFFSVSGRMLKTCEYFDFKPILGKLRPTRLVMIDSLKPQNKSEMTYNSMKLRDAPDKIFTKDYLNKLTNGL